MDKERQIRFLYPPLILIGSLLVGVYFDESKSINCIFSSVFDSSQSMIFQLLEGVGIGSFNWNFYY